MALPLRPAFVNHLMVYTLVGLGVSGSVGLGTVWGQHQLVVAASRNHALEEQLKDVVRQSEELTTEIAAEQDPAVLLRRNAEWRLGLVPPAPDRSQPIAEDPVRYLMQKNDRELLGRRPTAVRFQQD